MRRSQLFVVFFILFTFSRLTLAGDVELAFNYGTTFPTYEQTFRYLPGNIDVPIPGINIQQTGAFQLDLKGGPAFGGGVTFYFANLIGIEARIDIADVEIRMQGAQFTANVDLPAPFPDLTSDIDFGTGTVDLDRLRPISLNLKLRTPGPLRLAASGGMSYLPELGFSATQTVGLGLTDIDTRRSELVVATATLRAEAQPGEGGGSRLGFNAGCGLELQIAPRLSLAAEARFFLFDKHTLRWRRTADPSSLIEELLLTEIEKIIPPIEFHPTLFQATVGIILRLTE